MSNDSRERDPSRHDGVTIPCPACGRAFTAVGRQRWCSGACRAVGYRRRKQTAAPPVALAAPTPLRPRTVYECDSCSTRSIPIFSSPWVLEAGWRCDGRKRCKAFGAGVARLEAGYRCVPRLAL